MGSESWVGVWGYGGMGVWGYGGMGVWGCWNSGQGGWGGEAQDLDRLIDPLLP